MMSREELRTMYRDQEDTFVLSVYIDADQHDPAERDAWRVRFLNNVSRAKGALSAVASGERDPKGTFESALEHVQAAIPADTESFLPGSGWVAFATAKGLLLAETLPVPVSDTVRWERGLRVAPYLRVLDETCTTLVVIVDSQKAKIYKRETGDLKQFEEVSADTQIDDLSDVGTAKRATQRTGVRGKTGTDAAQNLLSVAAERLANQLAARIREIATKEMLIILGGTPKQIAAVADELPKIADRVVRRPELNFDMSDHDLEKSIRDVVKVRTTADLTEHVVGVFDEALRDGGKGTLGRNDTERALLEARVRSLVVTEGLFEADRDYSDRLIGTAFGKCGADAHVVSGALARRLDEEWGGVGALLHYTIR